ncbi:protein NYNRIN-like [Ahaetulla prasina]|uniref:protein NYNRIN-like n=1 Tax=Ahaetulla prasina TaxID=499056 RepID=UPI00264720B0|nr:protein NYNRIN-like [Ahaetulla prasina]
MMMESLTILQLYSTDTPVSPVAGVTALLVECGNHPGSWQRLSIEALAIPNVKQALKPEPAASRRLAALRPFRNPPSPAVETSHQQAIQIVNQALSPEPVAIQVDENGDPIYRFVHDLRAVNGHVIPRAPIVPNPATIITEVPASATHFTVVDLCSAFFSIPVDSASQYLFAFTWEEQQYTWTRLPQGYTESPTLFSQILRNDLSSIDLPEKSILIQYVDDLLLASESEQACKRDTLYLLNALAEKGHKASPTKLQYLKQEVTYLGYIIAPGIRKLAPSRIETILAMKNPSTKRQVRALLGVLGFCRPWIPSFGELAKPLIDLTTKNMPDPIEWTKSLDQHIERIKKTLASAPVLGLPDYKKPFTLFIHEKLGIASGVLTQSCGLAQRPVAYYSVKLDPVARGTLPCLRAVAATVEIVKRSKDLVLGRPLTLKVPHEVFAILLKSQTQAFTQQRLAQYEAELFTSDHITFERCSTLNPATLLPTEQSDNNLHDCLHLIQDAELPRPDLTDNPLENPDLELFTDGSSYMHEDRRVAGAAVVSLHEIIWAEPLTPSHSAQAAELIALTKACEAAENQSVNIYTDSRYAFGVCHATGALWKQRGFLTSAGQQIVHAALVSKLLQAIQLPREIAVIHCKAHQTDDSLITKGNKYADAIAKWVATKPLPQVTIAPAIRANPEIPYKDFLEEGEVQMWEGKLGATFSNGFWRVPDGRPIAPRRLIRLICQRLHSKGHCGTQAIVDAARRVWHAPGIYTEATRVTSTCKTCQANNSTSRKSIHEGGRPWAQRPFERVQMDYIQLPKANGYQYALICRDQLTHWVEAFPCRHATALETAKHLIKDIVPRFGVPSVLDMDRGKHFIAQVLTYIYQALGITQNLHCPYSPSSSGGTERANREVKTLLGKLCQETHLSWPQVLPIALFYIRTRPRKDIGISPFEILFGRPPDILQGLDPQSLSLDRGDIVLSSYLSALHKRLQVLWTQSALTQTLPLEDNLHPFEPGDWVWIKFFTRNSPLQPKWTGPYQILLTTQTAIRVAERDCWIHWTHAKPAVVDNSPAIPPIKLKKHPETKEWTLETFFNNTTE